jgi:hypothetical protein
MTVMTQSRRVKHAELVESKQQIEKFTEKTCEGMQSALNSLMKKFGRKWTTRSS